MTKLEAIEAAIGRINFITDASGCYLISPKAAKLCEPAADLLYEQGRIAGLREAARMVVSPRYSVYGSVERIRNRANMLAKKAGTYIA